MPTAAELEDYIAIVHRKIGEAFEAFELDHIPWSEMGHRMQALVNVLAEYRAQLAALHAGSSL